MIYSPFIRFCSATALTSVASDIFRMSFAWWMFHKSGSVMLFGQLIAVMVLFQIISRLVFGGLGDLIDPLKILRHSLGFQCCISGVLAFMAYLDIFRFPIFVTGLALIGALVGTRDPLIPSMIPSLVGPEMVTKAVGSRSALSSASSVVGPAFAGVIVSILGGASAMLISCLIIMTGTMVMFSVRPIQAFDADASVSARHANGNLRFPGCIARIFTGWYIYTRQGLMSFYVIKTDFYLCLISCLINVFLPAFFSILLPYLVAKVFKFDAIYLGVFDIAFAAGMFLGATKIVPFLNSKVGRRAAMACSLSGLAFMQLSFAYLRNPYALTTVLFICGIGMMGFAVNVSSIRLLATPIDFRTRIFASASFLVAAMMPAGSMVTSFLISFDYRLSLISGSLLTALCVGALFFIPNLRTMLRSDETQMREMYSKLYPRAFATQTT